MSYLPQGIILSIDLFIVCVSFSVSYFISMYLADYPCRWDSYTIKMLLCVIASAVFFYVFKTYSRVIRYSSFRDAIRIFASLFLANIILLGANHIINKQWGNLYMPNVGLFINFTMAFTAVFSTKMIIRLLFDSAKINNSGQYKTMRAYIYDVTPYSVDLVRMMNHSDALKYKPIGFVSPEATIVRKHISNLPVYHIKEIFENRKLLSRFEAIIIDPSAVDANQKQFILSKCAKYKKELLSTPPFEYYNNEQLRLKTLKKVKIEDLLQRGQIEINIQSIKKNLENKTLMITGGAGSIGSEIVRQVCHFKIKQLLICDIAESPLHEIDMEIKDHYDNINSKATIADIKNYELMKQVFEIYKPDVIYHAAAYKHVPLMEEYPCEAILTNVLGTKNIADLAAEYNVESFVMISTDKAVNPSNIMGASKRIAEIYVQSLSKELRKEKGEKAPRFIVTRFGNVLDSNGSVIPRFKKQIENGGPLTVTHSDIFRYFMTISEACRLVLEAGNFGKGGEIFVFDMGEPVKIKDMAELMIRLSGFEPGKDINITYTGLRPGEKLYEELLYDKETTISTNNPKIMIGFEKEYDYEKIKISLDKLLEAAQRYKIDEVVKLMKYIAPEFISQNSKYSKYDHPESEISLQN
jgi:FlaA1/EpsC-like NDP-sugar epimerase